MPLRRYRVFRSRRAGVYVVRAFVQLAVAFMVNFGFLREAGYFDVTVGHSVAQCKVCSVDGPANFKSDI